jgi:hypothetical protein
MDNVQLRTYVTIDNMQPQYAAATGTVVKGDTCLAGMAQLYIEMSPAAKSTSARRCAEVLLRQAGVPRG